MGEQNTRWANQNQSYCHPLVMNGRKRAHWHDILKSSLPPPIGYNYMAISSNLSSNMGSPNSFLCLIYVLSSLVAPISPGVKWEGLPCSCAPWLVGYHSAQQTLFYVNKDRVQERGTGPGYVLALRQHLRKVKPVKKANVVTGFQLTLCLLLPSLGLYG